MDDKVIKGYTDGYLIGAAYYGTLVPKTEDLIALVVPGGSKLYIKSMCTHTVVATGLFYKAS